MTRRGGYIFAGFFAGLLLAGSVFAQVGHGPISGGAGGSGGGVSGLTACDNGVALADNAILRANGTDECQGATTTLSDAGALNLNGDGTGILTSGNFPASATDECFARFNLTTGKVIQDSVVCATDAGVVSGPTQLNVDNLRLDDNTISSTSAGAPLVIASTATGYVDINGPTGHSLRFSATGLYPQTGDAVDLGYAGGLFTWRTVTAKGPYNFDNSGTVDTGLARSSAGVVAVTNGSTGGGALKIGDPGTRPTCDSTYRGTFWIEEGGAGVADTVDVCAKDSGDAYAWRSIY